MSAGVLGVVSSRVGGMVVVIVAAITMSVVIAVHLHRARQPPSDRDSLSVRQVRWLGPFAWLFAAAMYSVLIVAAVVIWNGNY